MTTDRTIIGTICHNDDNPRDPNHRRIEIWMDGEGVIWADRDNPHRPDVPKARDFDDAVRIASQAWSGPEWDFIRSRIVTTQTTEYRPGYWLHAYDADDNCLSSGDECYPTEAEAEQAVQTARSRHPDAARIDVELCRDGDDGRPRSEDVSAWEWSDAEQQFVQIL